MLGRLRLLGLLAVGVASSVCTGCIPAGPKIVATPNNVMVNSTVKLAGSGFPASKTIEIEECGATSWVVMATPCDAAGAVNVKTSSTGAFSAQFKMLVCPLVGPPPVPITARTCYVGEPVLSGVDTDRLAGAAKVVVTYP